jgi:hypothetical protein
MSQLLATALVLHIVLGLIGLGALHLTFMQMIRKRPPWGIVMKASWIALLGFLFSWVAGAYYYVIYYGVAVKPRIVGGEFPWAHQVFMEAKEHIFLLVPLLTVVALFAVYALRASENSALKSAVSALIATALILGVFVAAAGIIVSGGVR